MKVEFDQEKRESVLHLSAEELGQILYALYYTGVSASLYAESKSFLKMHAEISKEIYG